MTKTEELTRIRLLSRVDRTEIVKFFQTGFHKLPVYENDQLSRESRIQHNPVGWEIPPSQFGKGSLSPSLRETMRAWIMRHLSHYIPDGETIMVALEDWDKPRLMLYRRKDV
jgi:hypothetical protein